MSKYSLSAHTSQGFLLIIIGMFVLMSIFFPFIDFISLSTSFSIFRLIFNSIIIALALFFLIAGLFRILLFGVYTNRHEIVIRTSLFGAWKIDPKKVTAVKEVFHDLTFEGRPLSGRKPEEKDFELWFYPRSDRFFPMIKKSRLYSDHHMMYDQIETLTGKRITLGGVEQFQKGE